MKEITDEWHWSNIKTKLSLKIKYQDQSQIQWLFTPHTVKEKEKHLSYRAKDTIMSKKLKKCKEPRQSKWKTKF